MFSLINQTEKKNKGQYFTPIELVISICTRMIPYIKKINNKNNLTILDPAMGEGVFFNILSSLLNEMQKNIRFIGIEIDPNIVIIARRNLVSIIKEKSFIFELNNENFLLRSTIDKHRNKIDVCIGNPPHNARYSKSEWIRIMQECKKSNAKAFPHESSIFFVLKSLDLLTDKGILGFILPKPLIYSKRWLFFRTTLLSRYNLLEVLDLGNQFSGQLQEQCLVIIEKNTPKFAYITGYWDSNKTKFKIISTIRNSDALMLDNLLVGIKPAELKIIKRLHSKNYELLNIRAFRGISSKFRKKDGIIPLIEKLNISNGFIMPSRNSVSDEIPSKIVKRQQIPKIIAQRIISYTTKPKYSFNLKLWVDYEGTRLTHETVINIIPQYPKESDFTLTAIAGLLKSSFIEWWLRHAIYSKRFVTSKDFDNDYIRKIRVPIITAYRNEKFRIDFLKLIGSNSFNIINFIENRHPSDQLFCISEIYKRYQDYGEQLKLEITYLTQFLNTEDKEATPFTNFKNIFSKLKRIDEKYFLKEFDFSDRRKKIEEIIKSMNHMKDLLDKTVFILYKITKEEEKIILGNKS